jgi:hypothetical protein
MKTTIYTLLAFLLLFSCSSDDESTPSNNIVGEWTIYKYTNPFGTFESDLNCGFNFVEFKSNNTYNSIDYYENSCEVFEIWDGTWEINANALTFNKNTDDPSVATIQSITNTQMILSYPESNETIYYKR